jgi:hypothetical protein
VAEASKPILKVNELFQVCIVVHDLDKSMEHYQNVLGIGPWECMDIDPSIVSDMTYHGRPVEHSFRAAITMVGPIQLELIQPLKGDSIYSDFLKEHGEGLHHMGHVWVRNIAEAVKTLEQAGLPCIQSGRITHEELSQFSPGYAYINAGEPLGFILELLELPEGQSSPDMDKLHLG